MPDATPIRIAFTSCVSTEVFSARQPVWEDIGRQDPHVLVLLGDSIYIDCPWPTGVEGMPVAPKELGGYDFATHVHKLYQRQLAVPEFRQLVRRPGLKTYAIWDDHDFLWNDALCYDAHKHWQHSVFSSNLFQCWRQALAGEVDFPPSAQDPRVNRNTIQNPGQVRYDQAMPGYQPVELWGGGPWLHLTDGRSWRSQNTLLGTTQRLAIERVMTDNADVLHLLASGSTVGGKGVSGWRKYPDDLAWLERMASRFEVVVLSGDIHKNDHPTARPCGSRRLLEFVASGAAVDFAPSVLHWPPALRNRLLYERHFGLLTLEGGRPVQAQLFEGGQPTQRIDCTT